MDYADITSAKIELRNAGWTWNRKRRCWTWSGDGEVLEVPSLRAALRIHRKVQEIARGQA